jgi:lipooligosaccharide transport system permease protein
MTLLALLRPNAWRVFRRNFLAWQKYAWSSIAINTIEPIGYFLALGFGLGAYVTLQGHGSLVAFIAPGLLAVTAMNTSTFDSCWGCFERLNFNGVYESMVTAPVSPLEIAAGEHLWQAFRALLYGSAFLLIITLFGLVHSWWALLCPPVLALTGLLFSIPGLWMALLVKSQEHLFFYFSFAVTPMMMLGGVFFPLDRLPHAVSLLAWFTPLYHAVNVLRALVNGTLTPAVLGDAVWLLAAIALLSAGPVSLLNSKLGNRQRAGPELADADKGHALGEDAGRHEAAPDPAHDAVAVDEHALR